MKSGERNASNGCRGCLRSRFGMREARGFEFRVPSFDLTKKSFERQDKITTEASRTQRTHRARNAELETRNAKLLKGRGFSRATAWGSSRFITTRREKWSNVQRPMSKVCLIKPDRGHWTLDI